jgi:hypothetical protein
MDITNASRPAEIFEKLQAMRALFNNKNVNKKVYVVKLLHTIGYGLLNT